MTVAVVVAAAPLLLDVIDGGQCQQKLYLISRKHFILMLIRR